MDTLDTPDTPTLYASIAQRLADLAEAEARVKELRDSLRQDYDALRTALPRTRKPREPKPKRGRPRKIADVPPVE